MRLLLLKIFVFSLVFSALAYVSAGKVFAHGREDAMMIYDINEAATANTYFPKYKIWDGTGWGIEMNANPVSGQIRHQVVKYAPTRDEIMLVALTSTGSLQAQVFDGTSWGTVTTLGTIVDGSGSATTQTLYRGFDVEYEQSSGDAIIIYGDGSADPDYRVWNGSTWTDTANVNIPNTYVPNWIEMSSDPGSDELAMILVDGTGSIFGMRWDGTGWDAMGASAVWDSTASSIATKSSIDVAFETNSGDIMFMWGTSNTTDDHRFRTYVGTTLSANQTRSNANAGGQPHWVKLTPNPAPSSNQIIMGSLDAGADLNTFLWSGTAWSAAHTEHDAGTENILDPNFDVVYETYSANTGDAILVWGDGATVTRRLWDGAAWGAASTVGDDTAQVHLIAHPNTGDIVCLMYEDATSVTDDLLEMNQNGGVQTWSSPSRIWAGPTARRSGIYYVGLAAQKYNSSQKIIAVFDTQTIRETPKYRRWTDGAWGAEQSAQIVQGPVTHMDLKFSPTRNEAILVTTSQSGNIQAQVWDGTGWNTPQNLGILMDSNYVGNTIAIYRGFDFDYEQDSGDAVIVYGDGTPDPNYRVWNGSTWGSENDIDIPNIQTPTWIETTANYGSNSDELAMILVDGSLDVFGLRWDGTGWDSMGAVAVWDDTASIATRNCVDVAFERNSGEILYIWADAVNTTHWYYKTYAASTLSANTALTNANNGGIGHWVRAVANPDPSSNQIMIGGQDAGSDFNTRLWDGSAWDTAPTEHTAGCENVGMICFDLAFEVTNPGVAWTAFGNGSTVSRRRWGGASWAVATTAGDDTIDVDLEVQASSGTVFLVAYEDDTSATDDILETHIADGSSTWTANATIWGGPTRATNGLTLISIASEQYYVDFTQNDFEFFVDDTTVSLANAWPPGSGDNIVENLALTPLPATNMSLKPEDKIRLQMNYGISKHDMLSNYFNFKLQYAAAEDCTTATGWTDVGAKGSAEIWRLYDNAGLADSVTQVNQISTSTAGAEGLYSEVIPTSNNPTAVDKDTSQVSEWDWPIENNGASNNTSYCFRMVEGADYLFTTYNADGYPKITTIPGTENLMRHGNFFQNDSKKGFFWAN